MSSDRGHGGYQKLDNDVASLATEIEHAGRSVATFSSLASDAARAMQASRSAIASATEAMAQMAQSRRAAVVKPELPSTVSPSAEAASPAASMDTSGLQSAAALASTIAVRLASIGPTIRTSIQQGIAPISGLGDQVTATVSRMEQTFVNVARRIDASIRLPQTLSLIGDVRKGLRSAFLDGASAATKAGGEMAAGVEKVSVPATQSAAAVSRLNARITTMATVADHGLAALSFGLKAKAWFSSLGDVAARAGKPLAGIARTNFSPAAASAKTLARSVTLISSAGRQAGSSLGGIGAKVLAFAGVAGAGYQAFSLLKSGIMSAADLNETLSKTDAVMGSASAATKAFADDMSARFGMVKKDTLDAASGFAGLAKGLGGLSGKSLSDFSNQFTMLSADLSSFADMDFSEASRALMIGLSGEQSDTLKRLGVVLNETTVKQYALAHGIASGNGPLTEQQKLAARSGLIMEKLSAAQGDLERTSDSPKNAMRRLAGSVENIGTSIGQTLMPAVSEALANLTSFAKRVQAGIAANKGFFSSLGMMAGSVVDTVSRGLTGVWTVLGQVPSLFQQAFGGEAISTVSGWGQAIADAVDYAGVVIRNIPQYFEIVKIKAQETFTNLGAWINNIPVNLGQVADYFANNWVNLIYDGVNRVTNFFLNLGQNIRDLYRAMLGFMSGEGFHFKPTALTEGFKTTAAEIPTLIRPELVDYSKEVDAQLAVVGQNEAARTAKRQADAAKQAASAGKPDVVTPTSAVAEAKEMKSAASIESGSKEAYSAVLANRLRQGGAGEKGIKDVAKSNREQVGLQTKIERHLDRMANGAKPSTTPPVVPIGA